MNTNMVNAIVVRNFCGIPHGLGLGRSPETRKLKHSLLINASSGVPLFQLFGAYDDNIRSPPLISIRRLVNNVPQALMFEMELAIAISAVDKTAATK